MSQKMRERLQELERRRAEARAMGGAEKVSAQHARGKLTARERFALLFDAGDMVEIGLHATEMGPGASTVPGDAVICAWGKVNGRHVAAAAYDFTVMAGSIGTTGELKVARLHNLALTQRMPFVWLLDSAGARIQETVGSLFAGTGDLFREEAVMSGVVPQVAAMVGPGAAGTAYIPGLADFVPMVRGRSSMALGGPPLVKAATGQEISEEELGGSTVHCEISGGTFIGSDQDLRVSVAALMERIFEEVEAFHAGRPSAANAPRDPGEVVLQVRFPFRRAEASWWRSNTEDLLDAITSALDAARLGAVDDIEEEGDEMCVYVLGSKPEAMLDVTRQALRRITIPSGAYALLPRAGQEQLWPIDI